MNYSKKYFDEYTPSYSIERLKPVIKWLKKIKNSETSLLDVGCGDGSCLQYISRKTGIKNLTGIDESDKYIKIAKKNVTAKFICADVLKLEIKEKYDVVIIMAVLHHLIGKSRKESRELSKKTISNCLKILKNDGTLIIFEPVFSNYLMMNILFYLKKALSKISNNRITFFNHWNNIGAPVVSYFSKESLIKIVKQNGGITEKSKYILAKPKVIYKLLGVKRGDLYLQIKKV